MRLCQQVKWGIYRAAEAKENHFVTKGPFMKIFMKSATYRYKLYIDIEKTSCDVYIYDYFILGVVGHGITCNILAEINRQAGETQ